MQIVIEVSYIYLPLGLAFKYYKIALDIVPRV